ncbi:MAG: hypothetical protein ACNA8S_07145 [Deferrisomatales bacterium]
MLRRPLLFAATLALLTPFLLGLGGGGGSPVSDTIPRPKESFSAQLLDRQGLTTRVELLSCAGRTFFPLERGEGTLMVPFGKIRQVEVGGEDGSGVAVTFHLEGGTVLEGRLPRQLLCTGSTEFGNYQVELRGLSRIELSRP